MQGTDYSTLQWKLVFMTSQWPEWVVEMANEAPKCRIIALHHDVISLLGEKNLLV